MDVEPIQAPALLSDANIRAVYASKREILQALQAVLWLTQCQLLPPDVEVLRGAAVLVGDSGTCQEGMGEASPPTGLELMIITACNTPAGQQLLITLKTI